MTKPFLDDNNKRLYPEDMAVTFVLCYGRCQCTCLQRWRRWGRGQCSLQRGRGGRRWRRRCDFCRVCRGEWRRGRDRVQILRRGVLLHWWRGRGRPLPQQRANEVGFSWQAGDHWRSHGLAEARSGHGQVSVFQLAFKLQFS